MPQVPFYITHCKTTDCGFQCVIPCQSMCEYSPKLRAEEGSK